MTDVTNTLAKGATTHGLNSSVNTRISKRAWGVITRYGLCERAVWLSHNPTIARALKSADAALAIALVQ